MNSKEGQTQRAIELQSMKQILTSVNDKIESMPGKTVVNEVSNPLTTEPLEFGYFIMTSQEINSINAVVQIETTNSNVTMLENAISLKKDKDYKISANIGSISSNNEGEWRFRFCDKENDEQIGSDLKIITVTNDTYVSCSASTEFIYTPSKDMDIVLKNISGENIEIEIGSVNIQEIRNNPINQYGGFETQVLFEGEANAAGVYSLIDDVSNYNILIVEAKCYIIDVSLSQPGCITTRSIQTDVIDMGMVQQFVISEYAIPNACYRINFGYTKQNEMTISHTSNSDYWIRCFISRIIGVN